MRPFPETFKADGFSFRQIKRQGRVVLLEKTAPWASRPFYEVVIIQVHAANTFPNGQTYPARESMPGSEQWGQAGWSYSDLPSAERRFDLLLKGA